MVLIRSLRPLIPPAIALRRRGLVTASPAFHIPVIEFATFREASSSSRKQETANRIVNAFKQSGFIYLSGHGISSQVIAHAFKQSKNFFDLPVDSKDKLAWEDPRSNRGYVRIGRERVTQSADPNEIELLRKKTPDYKESIELGRDWDAEWKNMWPKESVVPGFKQTMLDFYQTCHNLHTQVMSSIALGLGLGEGFFADKIDQQCHNLRLLNYPPVDASLLTEAGTARAGAHSDYGSLTLLFQDSIGGLEVQNPHTQEFHAAPPIPDTIVINVGDLLSRWSNDVLRSTLHQVVAPPLNKGARKLPGRQSIAFFCNPNFDTEISCLPNCTKDSQAKYPTVTTGEYIVGRLTATYK